MNRLNDLLREVTELTFQIETDYPELYKYLDENPITLPVSEHPKIDKQVIREYLEGLKDLLRHHRETHKKD